MGNKSTRATVIGVVAVVVVLIVGYALIHKSNNSSVPTITNSSSQPRPKTSNSAKSTAPAVNNSILLTKNSSNLGEYLTDPSGRTLYTYSLDSNGISKCTSTCLTNWPAYQDTGSTTGLPANISTITRTDNSEIQYTYKGLPLYYFVADSGAGQINGNGVTGFTIAKP